MTGLPLLATYFIQRVAPFSPSPFRTRRVQRILSSLYATISNLSRPTSPLKVEASIVIHFARRHLFKTHFCSRVIFLRPKNRNGKNISPENKFILVPRARIVPCRCVYVFVCVYRLDPRFANTRSHSSGHYAPAAFSSGKNAFTSIMRSRSDLKDYVKTIRRNEAPLWGVRMDWRCTHSPVWAAVRRTAVRGLINRG